MYIQVKRNTIFLLILILGFASSSAIAQSYQWEVDKLNEQAKEKQAQRDSLSQHLAGRWAFGIGLGRWFSAPNSLEGDDALFLLPDQFTQWQFTFTRYLQERFMLDLHIGLQSFRQVPEMPSFGDVLAGEEVDLEGFGGLFLPIRLGGRYYVATGDLRPYVGLHLGGVALTTRYILASGNLQDGINRNELESRSLTALGTPSLGADYRLSPHVNLFLTASYTLSGAFAENVGGYTRYQGFALQGGLSVVFGRRIKNGNRDN